MIMAIAFNITPGFSFFDDFSPKIRPVIAIGIVNILKIIILKILKIPKIRDMVRKFGLEFIVFVEVLLLVFIFLFTLWPQLVQ